MAEDSAFYGGGEWAVVFLWLDHGVLLLGRAGGGGCMYERCDYRPQNLDSDDECTDGVRERDGDEKWEDGSCPVLMLDEAVYHSVDSQEVPNGYATVPVVVNDNGYEFPAVMVAGSPDRWVLGAVVGKEGVWGWIRCRRRAGGGCLRGRARGVWLRMRRGGGSMRVGMWAGKDVTFERGWLLECVGSWEMR